MKKWKINYEINKYNYNDTFENALFINLMCGDEDYYETEDWCSFFKDEVLEDLAAEGELHDYHWDCWVVEEEEFKNEKEARLRLKELINTKSEWLGKYIELE